MLLYGTSSPGLHRSHWHRRGTTRMVGKSSQVRVKIKNEVWKQHSLKNRNLSHPSRVHVLPLLDCNLVSMTLWTRLSQEASESRVDKIPSHDVFLRDANKSWTRVSVYYLRYICTLQVVHCTHFLRIFCARNVFQAQPGPVPPPILLLSDGGHVENLAILPLLKRRLRKIVVVDGGYKHKDRCYGDSLLNALTLARTKLNCSFLSEDGQDVIFDLLEKFVRPKEGQKPRYYKFVALSFVWGTFAQSLEQFSKLKKMKMVYLGNLSLVHWFIYLLHIKRKTHRLGP